MSPGEKVGARGASVCSWPSFSAEGGEGSQRQCGMLTSRLDLQVLGPWSHWLGPSHMAPTGLQGGWEIGVLERNGAGQFLRSATPGTPPLSPNARRLQILTGTFDLTASSGKTV